ncbi:hypothetical protein AALD22_26770 [Lachnospiraceae bacterium 56-18]
MSNDLISRNTAMDYLREQRAKIFMEKNKKEFISEDKCDGMLSAIEAFMNFVIQAPTAYDLDKVVNDLEEYAYSSGWCKEHGCVYEGNDEVTCDICAALGALEIVKRGVTA